MNVLVLTQYYLPGYKAGGPIRTVANTIEQLGDEISFRVVTTDRDLGDLQPYAGVGANAWQRVGRAEVSYLDGAKAQQLLKVITSTSHDLLYLNSAFSPVFTILPLLWRRLKITPRRPVIVTPKGEFSDNALKIKTLKKRVFLTLAKSLGLYSNVFWQVSSAEEAADVRKLFGDRAQVIHVPDLPSRATPDTSTPSSAKEIGKLRVVFLARIARMKNLHQALLTMEDLEGEVQFDIYGPMEDPAYYQECREIISGLPANIEVHFKGAVPNQEVHSVLHGYHLFFLPTLGEGFGHVILEALVAGCPVLISDRTPWRGLAEKGVGWDLPLEEPELFASVLQRCISMDATEMESLSQHAREFGVGRTRDEVALQKSRQLFQEVANSFQGRKVERG